MAAHPERPEGIEDAASTREVVSSAVDYRGRIWNVITDSFRLDPESEPITRDYISHPGAVAVLALNDADEVLLLRQYRHPVKMNLWEIPAGLLDVEGENMLEAAQRELHEEADLRADTWGVLVDGYWSPGSTSEAVRVYLARGLSEVPEAERFAREDEESEMLQAWLPLDEVVAGVLGGKFHNPALIIGAMAAKLAAESHFEKLRDSRAPWPEHPTGTP